MKKSPNSVWDWPYSTKHYLTHPWLWFKHLGYNFRDAYRRARYGWTYVDVWNMDVWLMRTIPPMLRHMATHGCAYPGREPFDTPEKWHKWLVTVSSLLESGLEDNQNNCNEYYNDYINSLSDKWTETYTDENGAVHHEVNGISAADRQYFDRAEEIGKDAAANVEKAFQEISKNFFDLWD